MLVISRWPDQSIRIKDTESGSVTWIRVLKCSKTGLVRFGVEAPQTVRVQRSETIKESQERS